VIACIVYWQVIPGRRLPAQCEDYATTADLATAMAAAAAPLAVESSAACLTLARMRTGDATAVA